MAKTQIPSINQNYYKLQSLNGIPDEALHTLGMFSVKFMGGIH